MLRSMVLVLGVALALTGCGDDDDTTPPVTTDAGVVDSSTPPTDSGPSGPVDSGTTPDSGRDAGSSSGDRCATDDPTSTLGCNGWASGDFAPNSTWGSCTPGETEDDYQGSCTSLSAICDGEPGTADGICLELCELGSTYITLGGCPSGFRCFDVGYEDFGLCFRDCNAANPCPGGYECDGEGSCVPAE